MQLDMHFYAVYALARSAGIKSETAKTIAYASQFVDDAIDDEAVILSNTRAILPTMTSHRPIDYKNAMPGDQWKVWVPFHFLPGNQPMKGGFVEKMMCRKNSKPAKKMLGDSLKPQNTDYWPHLIGICSHVFADTFSHFGFIGFAHPWNKAISNTINASHKHSPGILNYVKAKFEDFKTRFAGNFAEIVPVGHGGVGTYPDRPYLKWHFQYETGKHRSTDTNRDNSSNFLAATRELYRYFQNFVNVSPKEKDSGLHVKNNLFDIIKEILKQEAPLNERISSWKEHIASGAFFDNIDDTDRHIEYVNDLWRPRRAAYEGQNGDKIEHTDACRFIRAAIRHREYVLHELLPDIGLIIF